MATRGTWVAFEAPHGRNLQMLTVLQGVDPHNILQASARIPKANSTTMMQYAAATKIRNGHCHIGPDEIPVHSSRQNPRRTPAIPAARISKTKVSSASTLPFLAREASKARCHLYRNEPLTHLSPLAAEPGTCNVPGTKVRSTMGRVSGDKSRFNRQRRHKLARRVEMRALAESLREQAKAAPASGGSGGAKAKPGA